MASNTKATCRRCGGQIDHRSKIVKQFGKNTIRHCIHCGHDQTCIEHIVSNQNWDVLQFATKLMDSPNVEDEDRQRSRRIREELMRLGHVPENLKGEIRRLQKRYDTEV